MSKAEALKRTGRLIPEAHFDPANRSGHSSAEEARGTLLEIEAKDIARRFDETTYKGLVDFLKRTDHPLEKVIEAWNEAQTSKK
jgi:hypothetical protein